MIKILGSHDTLKINDKPVKWENGFVIVENGKVATVPINVTMTISFDGHKGCNHNWKNYVGFKEAYKYCTKCPEKRNLDEQ